MQKKVDKRNTTVYLDLTKNEGTLLKEMNKKTRNLIRKAQKKGIQISISENKEDLKEFTKLYTKTMKRANASSKYFFPLKFFTNTFKYLKNNAKLFVAKYNGKIIASSIFLHKQDLLHYHFSGSDENYLNLAPNNLLLWEAAKWGKRMGCTKFHLGGGLSDNYDDSLFHFKSGFSNTLSKFYTVNVIHNNNVYKTLNILKNESKLKKDGVPINGNFFPKYRG